MRRAIPVLLTAVLSLTSLCSRAEEWKKQFTTSGKLTLQVDTNDADIRISGWDRKEAEARVISEGYKPVLDRDVRVTDRQNGDRVELEVHRRSGIHINFGWRYRYVRIEINVPREANLNLHSGDGNIRVQNVNGELHLDSDDGEIEVRSAEGKLTADTRDGNIRAGGRFDGLDLHTGDGNVDVEAERGSRLSSGWKLRTGDGNVVLRIAEGLTADLDASTGDGHVSVDFPVTVSGSLREDNIRGKINGGGPPLELRTGDGDIELTRM